MTIELPGRPVDPLQYNPLAGVATIPAMRSRLNELRQAIDAQGERATAAGAVVAERRQALAEAEDVDQREAAALDRLRRAESEGEAAIAAKRESERQDRANRERAARREAAARQRAIEDGLIETGRRAREAPPGS